MLQNGICYISLFDMELELQTNDYISVKSICYHLEGRTAWEP